MEYIIIIVIVVFAMLADIRIKRLEDNIEDVECRLEVMHALLLELQPKVDKDLPVRLPEDVLEKMLSETKQGMFDYQIDKKEYQDIMKIIKEKY